MIRLHEDLRQFDQGTGSLQLDVRQICHADPGQRQSRLNSARHPHAKVENRRICFRHHTDSQPLGIVCGLTDKSCGSVVKFSWPGHLVERVLGSADKGAE